MSSLIDMKEEKVNRKVSTNSESVGWRGLRTIFLGWGRSKMQS